MDEIIFLQEQQIALLENNHVYSITVRNGLFKLRMTTPKTVKTSNNGKFRQSHPTEDQLAQII